MSRDHENTDRAFEILGVYFANCYWTRHYKTAVDEVNKGNMFDIVESYKVVIERYNRAFGKQESLDERINPQYANIVSDLKSYYEEQLNKINAIEGRSIETRLSDRDFIDTMSRYLLPRDEYERLGKYDVRKEKHFRMVITQTVAKFTMFVIRSGVSDVTDRQVRSNANLSRNFVRNWCDQFKTIITSERDEICNLILASRSGIDVSKESMESVPKLVVEKLQEEMQNLMNERTELALTVNKYVDYANKFRNLLEKEQKRSKKLEKALRQLTKNAENTRPAIPPVPATTHKREMEVIGNGIVKQSSSPASKPKVLDTVEALRNEVFEGEDYVKSPDSGHYLEEAGSVSSAIAKELDDLENSDSGDSYSQIGGDDGDDSDDDDESSYDSDDVVESMSDTLGSEDDMSADD